MAGFAKVVAVAFELFCGSQTCAREDPIPAFDGSFMWTELPPTVKCPDCGNVFRIGKSVKIEET